MMNSETQPQHTIHEEEDEEPPPFALTDSPPILRATTSESNFDTTNNGKNSHLFQTLQASLSTKELHRNSVHFDTSCNPMKVESDSQTSPPGLMESMMTDGSSSSMHSASTADIGTKQAASNAQNASPQPPINSMSSTYLMSSLHTVHSDAGVPSILLPSNSQLLSSQHSNQQQNLSSSKHALHQSDASVASAASVGFSQLLHAADDTHQLGVSMRMEAVPEDEEVEEQQSAVRSSSPTTSESGALIVEPIAHSPSHNSNRTGWLPSWGAAANNTPLQTPLLGADTPITHLLSPNSPTHGNTPLDRARETVETVVDDDQSFSVSMTLNSSCTIDGVMRILGNPELLRLWCDPIETLIVTSSSTEGENNSNATPARRNAEQTSNDRTREYEGEWIEATTTALGSPPSSVGFLYSAGQSIMETLGFASYGRITMFVERRRGHVGLTVGPFHGGINASHTITVSIDSGRVKVVDRVRLMRDEEDVSLASFFMCGAFDACLSRCVLPSVVGYLNQVTTSMARLKLLVENSDISSGNASIMVVNAPRR